MRKNFFISGILVVICAYFLCGDNWLIKPQRVEVKNEKKMALNIETDIPDANFRKCIAEMLITGTKQEYDAITETYWQDSYTNNGTSYASQVNADGSNLTEELLKEITKLQCPNKGITSLKGIEYLPNVWTINIDNNKVGDLSFSSTTNPRIHALHLVGTGYTSLTLDDTLANQLSHLDVAENNLGNSVINSYIVRYPNLTGLGVASTNLTGELDISSLTKLNGLWANDNQLTNIKGLSGKNFKYLIVGNNKLSSIDVSASSDLISLQIQNNNISKIDLSKNKNVRQLWIYNNKFTAVDLTNNTAVNDLNLSGNKIDDVVITSDNLKNLYLNDVEFKRLVINDNNPDKLLNLDLTNCKISQDELQNTINRFTSLKKLSVNYTGLTALDVSKLTNLEILNASHNGIKNLDLSKNTKLLSLNLDTNSIETINLTNNPLLHTINFAVNNLKSIDVSNLTNLQTLYLNSNSYLTSVDLSQNVNLKDLSLALTSIQNVSLDNNVNLNTLSINYDLADNINFSKLTKLTTLTSHHSKVIPIYGTEYKVSNILNVVPNEINKENYRVLVGYSGNTEYPEDYITGTAGGYYRLRFDAASTKNILVSNYNGSQKFVGWYEINFIQLKSDKYVIDEKNSKIDVGGDSDDTIKKNLKIDFGATIDIEEEYLIVSANGKPIKQFTLLRTSNPKTGDLLLPIVLLIAFVGIFVSIIVYQKRVEN